MARAFLCLVTLAAFCFATSVAQEKKAPDLLAVDSQWKGKLTQRGKIMGDKAIPPEFETVLVVTKRTDKEFECELREKIGKDTFVTYLCKGKVTSAEKGAAKVEFESVGVKASSAEYTAVSRVPYIGTLDGKTLKGTWKFAMKQDDTELDGDFTLERQ